MSNIGQFVLGNVIVSYNECFVVDEEVLSRNSGGDEL
jgi:hypothetical protein